MLWILLLLVLLAIGLGYKAVSARHTKHRRSATSASTRHKAKRQAAVKRQSQHYRAKRQAEKRRRAETAKRQARHR